MAKYKCRMVDRYGNEYTTEIRAKSQSDCLKVLSRNGYQAVSVEKLKATNSDNFVYIKNDKNEKKSSINELDSKSKFQTLAQKEIEISFAKVVTSRDIVIFLQNLLVLKEAKYNNIDAIELISKVTESKELRKTLIEMKNALEEGYFMYQVMESKEKVFPYIVTQMIKVGEISGNLAKAIKEALTYIEKTESIKKQVKRIIIPNVLTFIIILVILVLSTIFGLPVLQNVFDQVGSKQQLPAITVAFQSFVNWHMTYWYIPLSIILVIVAVIFIYISTPKGKYSFNMFKYKMPIFGKLIYTLDFMKLIRSLLLNVRNGRRIQDALEVSRNIVKNDIMISIVEQAINNANRGESWIEPFEDSGLGSKMMTEMLKVGMETDLESMMDKLLDLMEIDVKDELDRIMKVLPEVTYAIVGALLIFFVLVVLVPILQAYMGTFLFDAAGV